MLTHYYTLMSEVAPVTLEELFEQRELNPQRIRKILAEYPDTPEKTVLLAHLDWRAGKIEEVLGALQNIELLLPRNVWLGRALLIKANMMHETGLDEIACELHKQVMQIFKETDAKSDYAICQHDYAIAIQSSDPFEAVRIFKKCFEVAKSFNMPHFEMAILYNLVCGLEACQKMEEVRDVIQQLLQYSSEHWPALRYIVLVKAYEDAERYGHKEEMSLFLEELRRRPQNIPPAIQLSVERLEGIIELQNNRPEDCIERLEKTFPIEQQEQLLMVLDLLCQAQEQAGQLKEALVTARKMTNIWKDLSLSQQNKRAQVMKALHKTEKTVQQEAKRVISLEAALVELRDLNKRITEMSITDGLTKLKNRQYLNENGQKYTHGASLDKPAHIALMDIDGFKRINDTQGHAIGDKVLQILARELKLFFPTTDLCARYGGEEFILVRCAEEAHKNQLLPELKSFLRFLTKINWPRQLKVTLSIGMALSSNDNLEEALNKADMNMYVAKRAGGNQIYADWLDE